MILAISLWDKVKHWRFCQFIAFLYLCRCNENNTGLQLAIPLRAPTVEVQREEYGAVEVESVLTVAFSNRRMTVECVAFNLAGVSSDTLAVNVNGEHSIICPF